MNSQRIILLRMLIRVGIAIVTMLSCLPLSGATFTWDGGSFTTNNWTDTLNWNVIGAPDPDGMPVADNVIFGGFTRPAPNVDVNYVVNTVTFNNTATAFTIGGMSLNVLRTIANDDTQTQTFTNSVLFPQDAAINANSGGLTFTQPVTVDKDAALTVNGGFGTSIAGFAGSARVIKEGTGTLTLNTNASQSVDLTVNAGVVATNAALTTTFGNSSKIGISGGALNALGNLTLNGASLSRSATGNFTLAPGKTLTIQNGGAATFTGSYTQDTDATINVTGAGSTLTATTGFDFGGFSTVNVTAGGVLGGAIPVDLGNQGDLTFADVTVIVDGAGSAFNTGSASSWGSGFDTVSVTFRNGAAGALGTIELARSSAPVDSDATLSVESDADVTAGDLLVASTAGPLASVNGDVRVMGTGSTLTQTGASILTLGTSSAGDGSLFVQSGGTFTSGTGSTTVNAAGRISITGGTYNANGNITLNGGLLTRDSAGVFNLASGRTLTIQNGGDATFSGGFFASNGTSYQVSGAGSTLSAGFMNFSNGTSLTVVGGASATVSGSTFALGAVGAGTAVIDGSGTSLTVPSLVLLGGTNMGSSSLTFRNGAVGTFGPVQIGAGPNLSTNVWNIESDADVTSGNITIGPGSGTTNSVTISGNGSTITQTGPSTLAIGIASGNTSVLNLTGVDIAGSGATFNSGTGAITVNPTGVINVQFGTFNANGNMTVDGGQLNLNSGGGIVVAAGRTLTIQNGGDATATDDFALFTAATTNVTGPGSTLSATDNVQINNGATVNVSAGGMLNAGNVLEVGAFQTGTLVVDGVGSSVSAGTGNWGSSANTADITFRNGATGNIGPVDLANDSSTANFFVLTGSDVSIGTTSVSNDPGSGSGTITVDGIGSTLTQSGTLHLGESTKLARLSVRNGGAFSNLGGAVLIGESADIQIDGGSVTFRNVLFQGDLSVVNGSLTVNGLFGLPAGFAGTISAGAGGTIRFNGEVSGDGNFIGDAGLIEFAGGYRQVGGASTTNIATSARFLATNALTLQIGGLTPGTQHDELKFTGFGFPHVTFGGTLVIDLISGFNPQIGQQFDLFDFDPTRVAGSFSSIQPAPGDVLAPGLFFSDSQLYTTGVLTIVPEPGALVALLGGGAILLGIQRFGRRIPRER